jgi:ABC-type sugar transport system ATPase subunit
MVSIRLEHVTKRFYTRGKGEVIPLNDLSLEVPDGEVLSIIGPTGCGKTTLLRVVAGLERVDSGNIYFDGTLVTDQPAKIRGIGMVFQNYALYPHWNSWGNLAFFFRLRRWAYQAIDERVQETSKVMGIGFEKLLGRMPRTLSGGEKQRVALARCIIREPRLFLLDEPMSNLDAKLRVQTRGEIKRLLKRFGITTLFVTHDQAEAVALGDRIAVMREGRIEQMGTYLDLYYEPRTLFVAGFVGTPPLNLFPGTFCQAEKKLVCQTFSIPLPGSVARELPNGAALMLGVRAEHIETVPHTENYTTWGEVDFSEILVSDQAQLVHLRIGESSCVAKLPLERIVHEREKLYLRFITNKMLVYDAKAGTLLSHIY